ncbi:MAG: alpha/beta hydrolase [Acetobacteraceae bacterium]|nr:alpha/beta hydrolase [Acetobacteraceae bacterium]
MPTLLTEPETLRIEAGGRRIFAELAGPAGAPCFVLVNGLTQYAPLWAVHRNGLVGRGYRVATFDLFGQGQSDKPALFIGQDDQVQALDAIIDRVADAPVFVAGISFGGVIALRHAIAHGGRLAGLVALSTFATLSPQLRLIGAALLRGLVVGGIDYMQDLLLPMNLSDAWLGPRLGDLRAVKHAGFVTNDLFALQNLMQSFIGEPSLAPDLPRIGCPTMILNGEFDFLTPRHLHDELRRGIPDSELVLVPRAYHAFTLELPELVVDLFAGFADAVLGGLWQGRRGGQRIWVAPEAAGGALAAFPEGFDPLRAIPVPLGGTR